MDKNYYLILNLSEHASMEEIKHAFRQLALQYHPDINPSPEAQQKFIEISEAYDYLLEHHTEYQPAEGQVYARNFDKEWKEVYEEIRRETRDRAMRAKAAREEKAKKQKEELQRSGLYDLALAGSYLVRFLAIFFTLGLIAFPVVISFTAGIGALGYLFFFWLAGAFLIVHIYSQRKTWFRLGPFYYRWRDLAAILAYKNPEPKDECWYCRGEKANGLPYTYSLLFIKEVQIKNRGPLQHYAGYKRDYVTVHIPRSRKAFCVHLANSLVKIILLIASLLFLPLHSILWRFLAGLLFGGLLAWLINLVSGTRSKSSYLFTPGILFKILLWIVIIILLTSFSGSTCFQTSDYTGVAVIVMAMIIDPFIDLFARMLFSIRSTTPLFRQPGQMDQLYHKGYQNNLEIPFWSTIYPLLRYIF